MARIFHRSFFLNFLRKIDFLLQPIFKITGWLPVTFRSILLIPLLVWVRQAYGINRSDFVLLVLSEGGIALIGFSVLVVTLTALMLRFKHKIRSTEPYQIETNRAFKTGYVLRKVDWIPFIQFQVMWKKPSGVKATLQPLKGGLSEEIISSERGIEDRIIRQIKLSDLFGLSRIRFEELEEQKIKISPSLMNAQLKPLFKQFGGGDFISHPLGEKVGDRTDLRRYVRGDPLKHILWKVYARTRKLMIREVELAISPEHKTFIYFIASDRDDATASMTRTVLEKGEFQTNFVFLADGQKNPTSNLKEAIEQIIQSVKSRNQSAQNLSTFVKRAEAEGGSSCLVFASGDSFQWIEPFLSSIRNTRIQIHLILTVGDYSLFYQKNFVRRLLFDSALAQQNQ